MVADADAERWIEVALLLEYVAGVIAAVASEVVVVSVFELAGIIERDRDKGPALEEECAPS